ncbi:MAG: NAD+ synthase, partial [Opitutaceae bacterium]|nr:NAD+ synthase [Opitutaceae bacterium]
TRANVSVFHPVSRLPLPAPMRIGLAQLNPTVGDLAGNTARLLAAYRELVAAGAELVVTPELAVCGYPPRDLLLRTRFVQDVENATAELAAATGDVPLLVGTVVANPSDTGRRAFNAAAFCHHGRIQQLAKKCLLPTYDVFDEDRYFEPATAPTVIVHAGRRIGVTICEDIWANESPGDQRLHKLDPVAQLKEQGIDLLLNLSASPWYAGKNDLRERIVSELARDLGAPVVYCNAIGGNDELIFDGRSLVAAPDGTLAHRLPAFAEAREVISVGSQVSGPSPQVSSPPLAEIHAALVLGLRDYAHKSGFKRALVALSGGIDSALVAELAVAALGAENVIGVSLPSAISSEHSKDDARDLARNLGIRFETIAIADTVASSERALAPLFAGRAPDVTEENLQARTRGVLMMALSNKFGALLLTTGNKSEVAVGYCTLYGDMCGGLAVISDLFKTQVFALCRWINESAGREIIPRNTIEKPPSAELRPGQVDQDSLPPYDVLDALLAGYVEEHLSRAELVARGFPAEMVRDICRKVDLNEYKRKQAAPGLKITPLAFGVGRRIPIVQKYVG